MNAARRKQKLKGAVAENLISEKLDMPFSIQLMRIELNNIRGQYDPLPHGPERFRLWKKATDLLHEIHSLESNAESD